MNGLEAWGNETTWHGAVLLVAGLGMMVCAPMVLMRVKWAIEDAKWRRGARQSWAMSRVASGMRFGEYSPEWLREFMDADATKQWKMYDDHFQAKRSDRHV